MNEEKALSDPKLKKLFDRTFKHPSWGSFCEWVSVEWLVSISEGWDSFSFDPDVEWASLEEGLKEPLIITVGSVTGKARLDSGGKIASLLLAKGILYAPAVCVIAESEILNREESSNPGKSMALWVKAPVERLGPYSKIEHAKPSDVIPSCPCFGNLQKAKASNPAALKRPEQK